MDRDSSPDAQMPTDPLAQAATVLAMALEERIAEEGWDQPASLFSLRFGIDEDLHAQLGPLAEPGESPTDTLARLMEDPESPAHTIQVPRPTDPEVLDLRRRVGPMAQVMTVQLLGVTHGHPFDAMVGYTADPDVMGLAVAFEAWAYPEHLADQVRAGAKLPPPSTLPEREEVRHVLVVLRDGTVASVGRVRDRDPKPLPSEAQIAGRLPAALRRALGLPSGALGQDEVPDARLLARRWWLWALHTVAEHLSKPPTPIPLEALTAMACTYPASLLKPMPLPLPAFVPLLDPSCSSQGPTRPTDDVTAEVSVNDARRADWEAVRVALASVTLPQDTEDEDSKDEDFKDEDSKDEDQTDEQSCDRSKESSAPPPDFLRTLARWADAELLACALDTPPSVPESLALLNGLDLPPVLALHLHRLSSDPDLPFTPSW